MPALVWTPCWCYFIVVAPDPWGEDYALAS